MILTTNRSEDKLNRVYIFINAGAKARFNLYTYSYIVTGFGYLS